MKKIFFMMVLGVLKTMSHAQQILKIDHFSNIFIPIQSMLEIGTDTIRVGGVTPAGEVHWMDFKTILSTQPLRKTNYEFKPNLAFQPTALQFVDKHHILLAGSRHQDTLEWSLWNMDSMRAIKGGLLPDSLRRGQINVVRRLKNGKILWGGKKYGDMQLILMDSMGKVQKVLHSYKELKDEILDIVECDSNKIIISGYLKDISLSEKLMYILNIDSSLSIQEYFTLGHTDSLNVAYSSVFTPQKTQLVAGTSGTLGLVMGLDSMGKIAYQLPLKRGAARYKNFKIQKNNNVWAWNRHRIWATEETGAMTVFWFSSPD